MKKVWILIMGDKELAKEIAQRIGKVLKTEWKEYPLFDKQRRQIDETKTELYTTLVRE
ncbi:hypothetical protein KEJ51_04610 [Candidatus Bathyarchaeota archaeon]|nr:hypothetical protein [Candidatus Bathyarchaeota archaeon]MBS7629512.1 hypothetical protein [Candidatus Bathyarchaeota archaeon]MBS7631990.1 hypothetical protein [Candidatus Bathyarchaeota archaeon]